MKYNFLSSFFVIIAVLVVFATIVQAYSTSPNITAEITDNNFHFSLNSDFSWPIPRLS